MSESTFQARREAPLSESKRPPKPRRRLPVQAKLIVGAADDPYEREADSVADQVIDLLHTEPTQTNADTAHRVMTSPVTRISRLATIGAEGGSVDRDTEQQIASARSGGKPLEGKVRRRMEGAFGTDFSDVRVHVGAQSDALNQRIQARAFTTGSDIFVRQQDYNPASKSGEKLLAHELAHTVQQGGGAQRAMQRSTATIQRWGFRKGSTTETNVQGAKGKGTAPVDGSIHESVNNKLESGAGLLGSTSTVTDTDSYRDDIAKATKTGATGKSGASDKDTANLGIASGVTDISGMFINISKCVAVFGDKDKSSVDKAGAVMETGASVVGGAKGVSSIVKGATTTEAAKDGMAGAKDANSILSGLADSANAIKEAFFIVKGIIELAKEAEQMSNEEKFKASMDIIRRSLEAAKSVVNTVKTFLDLCGSGVSAAMVNTIPGLGIAIACAELVVRGVDLVMSISRASEMKSSKRGLKEKLSGVKGKNWGSNKSFKDEAEKILSTGKLPSGADATDDDKSQASEYLTAKSLQYINNKRSRRALLKIGVAMAKLAGDAATLGGVSAPVGIGLKVGAVAVDIGAGLFRNFKQWARDKVAEKEKKNTSGKPSFLAKVFNTNKSTEKKTLEYNRIIDNVLDMIVAATPATPTASPEEFKKMVKVESYITAMGFSIKQLDRESAKGALNLHKKMLEALKKRE